MTTEIRWATALKPGNILEGETIAKVRRLVDSDDVRVETTTGKVKILKYWDRMHVDTTNETATPIHDAGHASGQHGYCDCGV